MDATDVVVAVVFVSVAIAVKALPFTSSKKMQKVVEWQNIDGNLVRIDHNCR